MACYRLRLFAGVDVAVRGESHASTDSRFRRLSIALPGCFAAATATACADHSGRGGYVTSSRTTGAPKTWRALSTSRTDLNASFGSTESLVRSPGARSCAPTACTRGDRSEHAVPSLW